MDVGSSCKVWPLDKQGMAQDFFLPMENYLNEKLPSAADVYESVLQRRREYKKTGNAKLLDYEPRFIKTHVVPLVHKFLSLSLGDGTATGDETARNAAKQAVLAEGFNSTHFPWLKDCSCGTPASAQIYPWKKNLISTLKTARNDWWGKGKVLSNSCPDLAVRLPGGPSVVFEGKLFCSGGTDAAKSAIVAGIYECFFYRALPTLLKSNEPHTASYQYACFLAYDASPQQMLRKTWEEINSQISESCWKALNIHVMIMTGSRS